MDAIPRLPCRGSSLPQDSLTKTIKLKLAFLSCCRCPMYCTTNSERNNFSCAMAENIFKVILTWYHCRNFGYFLRFCVLKQVRRGRAATEKNKNTVSSNVHKFKYLEIYIYPKMSTKCCHLIERSVSNFILLY